LKDVIIVTGAAGFIGFHLCRRLLAQGESVVGLDNLNDYYDPRLKGARLDILNRSSRFNFLLGDLCDAEAVESLVVQNEPRVVYHLGAQAGVRYSLENPRSYMQSNIEGTFNLLEAVRKASVEHLLYASSSSVYGNHVKTPFSVNASVDKPVSFYASSKRAVELMVYAYACLYGIPSTGLRFFTVYGPFGRPDMAYFSFTKKILAGEPIDVYHHGELLRDFTFVDDVIDGLIALKEKPPVPDEGSVRHKVYNLGNSQPVRLDTFIAVLEKHLGKTAERRYLPMQAGDVYETYADITESTQDFGFIPKVDLEEGLKHFTDWYRGYYEDRK